LHSRGCVALEKNNIMIKKRLFGSVGVAAVVLLSSARYDNVDQVYETQIRSIDGTEEINGRKFWADSVAGKMLIINFWASYDATSRINNFDLVALAEEYRDRSFYNGDGLEVISISLDRYKSPLRQAILTDGTSEFHHICDYKGLDSELASSFDVNSPVNMLIDADGKVVARDFKVSQLRSTLQMLANNE